jgi:hypothetical protein
MKELTIEEKAQRYDEAIERARKELQACGFVDCDAAKQIFRLFPELKESEDERVRNKLIKFFKGYSPDEEWWGNITQEDILAWLEKQGEQNPADKVEPKFKIGDWVIDKQGIVHQIANVIENVTYHIYSYDIVGGGYFNDNTEGVRLWTIKDAKDGDVLCSEQIILLFKKWEYNNDWNFVIAYAGIDTTGKLQITDKHWFISSYAHPATKEQRDLLFQKMKEAGYEWDSEKKELKKIEQKSVNKEESLTDVEKSILNFADYFHSNRCKPEHEWIDEIKMLRDYIPSRILKPAEWSEEDEEMIDTIISDLERHGGKESSCYSAEINYLKSLKDRYTWKPSDEQMHYLSWVANIKLGDSVVEQEVSKHLNELLEDLKKLMEE